MIQLVVANGNTAYGIYKFLIDSIEDLKDLPPRAKMGSEAIIISTNETYVKNGNGQWILKLVSGGSGGGGETENASPIPETTINSMLNDIFGEDGENI